ncbi:hypothetical protein [Leyella stercorea]|jgi:hypothetical protein|uniref:hypothetical protein n=1 Tax=Leyella stercorea TaxID=363265 RepID=UPI00241C5F2A|nr:hypothetical protein [Leyella stercorea]
MSKVVFLSFANSVYVPSLKRLKGQIRNCSLIDEFNFFTDKDLDKNFRKDFHPYIYRRGYGYWKWKSYLVKQQFDRMHEGDILVYSDAGCDYNDKAEHRFKEYLDIVRLHESGILVFEDDFLERQFTKGDVFRFLIEGNTFLPISDLNQRWGGMWVMRKCANTTNLINKWCDTCMNHFYLITDKASDTPNFPEFIENRHDQSVFSILTKQHGAYALPPSELDKTNFQNVPFLPTRHKVKSSWTDIRRKLMLPYRYLVGMYLVKVKGFYFKDRIAW